MEIKIKEKFESDELHAIASALIVHCKQLKDLADSVPEFSTELAAAESALQKVKKCLFT